MTIDKGIPIKNVYYMLTYAFKELKHNNYERIAGENFDNIYDLFAEILYRGLSYRIKQGLHKEYVVKAEALPVLKGKLNLSETIKERSAQRTKLACEYDDLTVNNVFNQIIKSAIISLIKLKEIDTKRKKSLRSLLAYLDNVDIIPLNSINWTCLRYDRNTRTYQMLHSLCYFLLKNMLLSTEKGEKQMMQFSDEHMNLLFQRFVLEYYRKHHPEHKASAKQIKWNFTDSSNQLSSNLLPIMQSDITLIINGRTLIVDTKYYRKNLIEHFGKPIINSPNFYQLHTYVMNEDIGHIGNVDGMLLYAQTTADVHPNENFTTHDGNILMVRTIDLNQDFEAIKKQLENLITYSTSNDVVR